MEAQIFDGIKHAKKIEDLLSERVRKLSLQPVLVSILIGENDGSERYVSLKQKFAERIGAKMIVQRFSKETSEQQIIDKIRDLNEDDAVDGIMIQLPVPSVHDKDKLIEEISSLKDVDGMKDDSSFISPVALSVLEVIKNSGTKSTRVGIVGANGFIGSKVAATLSGYDIQKFDKGDKFDDLMVCDIVISASGEPDLISSGLVKQGSLCIDIGAPRAEFSKNVYEKAGIITPVPGGIGPMTIAYLMHNLVESAVAKANKVC